MAKMEESISILNSKDRKLLLETRNLIEELLETLDAMSNPDEVARIKEAELEIRDGKGRPLSELENELKKRKEI
jgi:hypothetical protein